MRVAVVIFALVALAGFHADAAPAALSTSGEATVYLRGDFRRDFTVEYNVQFWAEYTNTGRSTFAITLVGGPPPSDEVTIGVFAAARSGRVFTAVTRDRRRKFRATRNVCSPACRLSLRGDVNGISAFMDDTWLQSWPRFSLRAPAPAFQLNAEVSTPGDRVTILLDPLRTTAGGRRLEVPTCGKATRGMQVDEQPSGQLSIVGVNTEAARPSYIELPARHPIWVGTENIRDRCGPPGSGGPRGVTAPR